MAERPTGQAGRIPATFLSSQRLYSIRADEQPKKLIILEKKRLLTQSLSFACAPFNRIDWSKTCQPDSEDEWSGCDSGGCKIQPEGCCGYASDWVNPCNDWYYENSCPAGNVVKNQCERKPDFVPPQYVALLGSC